MINILIIDDNITLLGIYSEVLREEGYNVSAVESGAKGLEILKSGNFEIVLLDIMMEPMNGWEILKAIREIKNSAETEIVIVTAKALNPDEVFEYGDMIQGFIMKPVHIDDLKDYLNMLVMKRIKREEKLSGFTGDDAYGRVLCSYEKKKQEIRVWEELLNILDELYGADRIRGDHGLGDKVKQILDRIASDKSESEALKMALSRAG